MGSLRTLINTIKTKLDTIAEDAKPFDVHDDVTTQNTSPSGGDRIPHSDESAAGDPNEYFRLDTLRDYVRRNAADTYALIQSLLDYNDLSNQPTIPTLRSASQTYALIESLLNYDDLQNQPTIPTLRSASQTYALIQSLLNYDDLSNQPTIPTPFDIHDDVTTENTAPANQDRIPHSDESAAGDPNEYFRLDTLRDYFRRDAADTYALIESLLPEGVTLRTAAQTYALIQSLLNYNDLSNQPTIPTPFDIHDDVTTQNTSPSGADRIPHSDESASGDPNEYFRLDVLRDYFRRDAADTYALIDSLLDYNDLLNQPTIPTPFDVHDDVDTQNTNPNDADRIPHSDESAGGDPNKYFRLDTLKDFFGGGGGGLERETTLPDAADAVSGAIYAEVDSDDAILNDVLKVKSFQPNPFFDLTVAGLGNNQRGYSASGFAGINSGGTSGYSNLGALFERLAAEFDGNFERVGASTMFGVSENNPNGLAYHNGVLYMVGADNYWLYTLNPSTGVATRVGNVSQFGVSENSPSGLASHNGVLYMVGSDNDWLYTLNTTTGVATRVGSSTAFGVSENTPQGLASHNGVLYMVGSDNNWLYTLNTTTGAATRVGNVSQFGVSENNPQGLASFGGTLYLVGSDNDALYILNTTTGVASYRTSPPDFLVSEGVPSGLASHNGVLYMVGDVTNALLTLNTTTGVATRVGSATSFGVSEGVPTGLASHNGVLYMVGDTTNALYTLNTTTGVATRVGSSTAFGVSETTPTGLASHNGVLYMVGDATNALYTLNTTTGVATRVGSSSGFGVGEGSPQGLAFHNGVLYMVGAQTDALFTLNTTTGVATRVGSSSGFGVSEFTPQGLASHNGVLYMVGATNDALYTLNTTTGVATYVGGAPQFAISEGTVSGIVVADSVMYIVGSGLDYLAMSAGDIGNRWVAQFADDTTEVGDDDDTLKLFTERGGDEIELTRDENVGDSIAFISESDGETAHTISSGDDLDVALYKDDDTQLYEGSDEAVYRDIPLETPAIGV